MTTDTTDPIAAALPVCAGISYQLGVAGYFDASDYLRTDYMRGYVAATLADALTALQAENQRLREALHKIEAAPAWGYPDRWETTPAEVRQLARAALRSTEVGAP